MTHFVTSRCIHSRMLLRPSRTANRLVIGVFAKAAQRYNVRIFGLCVLSNHYHLLISTPDASTLSSFMQYANGNIAREIGRLHRWNEKFWGRRYRASLVLDDAGQIARLKYIFSNSFKEGLVKHARYWPGVHCHQTLVEKRPLVGLWVNRTSRFLTGKGNEEELTLQFHKLPCLSKLSDTEYREKMRDLSRQAHQECEKPKGFLGQKRILEMSPHLTPGNTQNRPAPFCHAGCQMLRRSFRLAYIAFVEAYRLAFTKFRQHAQRDAFPRGGLPPVAWFKAARDPG